MIVLLGARGAAALLSAIWFLLASRALGPQAIGELALALSLSLVASIGAEFGTSAWLTAAVVDHPDSVRDTAAQVLRLRTQAAIVGGALVVGAYLVASTGKDPVIPLLFCVSIVASPAYGVVHTVCRAIGAVWLEATTEVSSRALMVVAAMGLGDRLTLTIAAGLYAIVDLGSAVVHLWILRRFPQSNGAASPRVRWASLKTRGSMSLLLSALQRLDVWVAALFLGSHETGVFGATRRIAEGLSLPGQTVGAISMGTTARSAGPDRPTVLRRMVAVACGLTAVLAAPVAIFANDFVRVLLGGEFSGSAGPLRALCLGAVAGAAVQVSMSVGTVLTPRRSLRTLLLAAPIVLAASAVGSMSGRATGTAFGAVIGMAVAAGITSHQVEEDLARSAAVER